jgi:ATP-dependent Clp protease adaptor protein ClpS
MALNRCYLFRSGDNINVVYSIIKVVELMGRKVSPKHETHDVSLLEPRKTLTPPPMYQVWLLNDDYTPMDFVIDVLQRIFQQDSAQAEQMMLKVHTEGRAVCGQYTYDVAQTKVERVLDYARGHGYPLQCVMEGI